jgi:hypothetical protein
LLSALWALEGTTIFKIDPETNELGDQDENLAKVEFYLECTEFDRGA